MKLHVLRSVLVAAGLLLAAGPGSAQAPGGAGAQNEGEAVGQILGHLQQQVTVIRDNGKKLQEEKLPALEKLKQMHRDLKQQLPPESPVLAAAETMYAQSVARVNTETQNQARQVTEVDKNVTFVDTAVRDGTIRVPAGELQQVGLKLRGLKDQIGDAKNLMARVERGVEGYKTAVNADINPEIVRQASNVTERGLLVAKAYLPGGTLNYNETATGFYLIINNDGKEHAGTLTVTVTTGNATVDGVRELKRTVTVGGYGYKIESFTFRRTADGEITVQSGFLHDKR
jgi:hypothetical protein